MKPIHYLFNDDGTIPNSKFPLLLYKKAFSDDATGDLITVRFADNNWLNAWRNGVYDYHHYHSITHEVLGICEGFATLQFGGENGEQITVEKGDVVIIPAGVAHKKITASPDFAVVGAYPNGRAYDLLKGQEGERPEADQNIRNVPIPETDPVYGKSKGLYEIWKATRN